MVETDMNAAGRMASYAREKLARFESCLDEAVATGDVDAVHDLRVASRRLHEPLILTAEWIGRRKLKPLERGLKRFRRAFRKVRDLDVLHGSLLAAPSAGPMNGDDLAELEDVLTHQRESALAACEQRCRKLKPPRVIRDVSGICASIEAAGAGIEEALRARLRERMGRLTRDLLSSAPRDGEGADLHAARIQVKRMRYCAELVKHTGSGDTKLLIESLVQMQNLLGQWNDDVTAARWLGKLGRRRRVLAGRTAWAERLFTYAAARARSAEDLRHKILDEWPGVVPLLLVWNVEVSELEGTGPTEEATIAETAAVAPSNDSDRGQVEHV